MARAETSRIILIIFGVPGVGKGTFGRLLAKEYNYKRISPGDFLRKQVKSSSNSLNIAKFMAKGQYVDDRVVCDIVRNNMFGENCGYIFDGIPRTGFQAEFVRELAGSLNHKIIRLNLTLTLKYLISRLLGRRVCKVCDGSYNVFSVNDGEYVMDPLLPTPTDIERCPGCSDLVRREDDTLEVIKNRIRMHNENYKLVIDKLGETPSIDFEIKRGVDDFPLLRRKLEIFLENIKHS